jgi:hypothetical protein
MVDIGALVVPLRGRTFSTTTAMPSSREAVKPPGQRSRRRTTPALVDQLPEVTGTVARGPVWLLFPSRPDSGAMSKVGSRNSVASESVRVSAGQADGRGLGSEGIAASRSEAAACGCQAPPRCGLSFFTNSQRSASAQARPQPSAHEDDIGSGVRLGGRDLRQFGPAVVIPRKLLILNGCTQTDRRGSSVEHAEGMRQEVLLIQWFMESGGVDGTRTRDLRRDRGTVALAVEHIPSTKQRKSASFGGVCQ